MGGDVPPMDDSMMMPPPPPMNQEPPMGTDDMPPMDEPQGGEDDELMNVINSLSTEDKAAVLKYAKSMADDEPQDTPPMDDGQGGMPPMGESRVIEAMRPSVNGDNDRRRDDKKLPKAIKNKKRKSPYISPY